ncbi:type IV toxin-antitoxin system AbiEi family antitoxin domain-containing protein [Cellulomonas sp. P5_C5]
MRTPRPVPSSLLALAFRQEDLLSAAQCGAFGIDADARTRLLGAGTWQRVTHAVYDVAPGRDRRRDADHRRRRAAWTGLLALGPRSVAVGPCALALLGVSGLPLDIVPEVALPDGRFGRSRDGVRVRQFSDAVTSTYGGHGIVSLSSALVQALPELPRVNAVAVIDDCLRRGLQSWADIDGVRRRVRSRRGSAGLEGHVFGRVDPRAESPLETFARLQCVDAGIAPDELQVVVRSSDGVFLGRGDLGWRRDDGGWLIAEIDGREFHDAPDALHRDRTRQNALVTRGAAQVLRFTSKDIRSQTIPPTVRAALTRPPRTT